MIQFILDKNGKAPISTADHDGTKFTREEDMKNRVLAVLAAIATKTPLSIFDNLHMKRYTQCLNSKHHPPYELERNRIVEVIIDYVSSEIAKILEERRLELGEGFVLVATDFLDGSSSSQAVSCTGNWFDFSLILCWQFK